MIARRLIEEARIFLLALQFLTRLPLPAELGYTPARMAATARWHPGVGALIGALVGASFHLAALRFPPLVAALLSTGVGLLLTGCFHEDGFADACDGLGGAVTRERALEIMRDSRLGTYGAAGLGMILALKIAALAALPLALVPWVLIAGHALSRGSSVLVLATSTYVRDHGTGKPVADGIGPAGLAFALACAGLTLAPLGLAASELRAILAGLFGLALGHLAMRRGFERRLGGYTGDCLGAVQQTSELGFILGVLAAL